MKDKIQLNLDQYGANVISFEAISAKSFERDALVLRVRIREYSAYMIPTFLFSYYPFILLSARGRNRAGDTSRRGHR